MKKKMRIMILLIFTTLSACAGGGEPIEYNEDEVLAEVTQYLEEKYPGERFEYINMSFTGGTDYVDAAFYALDNPKEIKMNVQWRKSGRITDNYERLKVESDARDKKNKFMIFI